MRNNVPYNTGIQVQPEFRQCFNCNYEAVTDQTICLRCRKKKFFRSGNIRTRGIVLLVVGLFLVVFMGAIGVFVALMLLGSMDPESARKINNEWFTLIAIYCIFAAVIAFGLNSIVSGLWMIAAGRRNRFLVWVMWALLLVLLVAGVAMRTLLN
ncbi:MAG TPA: hypothetical protein VJL58_06260 [Pyrinomonadaceae bacterium]|nr:hypothetical protein [Pyrinomonadaceae bacterium]